jgi:hypothetical protein
MLLSRKVGRGFRTMQYDSEVRIRKGKKTMGLFKQLGKLFAPRSKSDQWAYWVNVKCNRCGELIQGRVDLRNDLSIQYGEDGSQTYFTRKVLMGQGHCFQRVEVEMTFDKDHRLMDRQISGGKFVDEQTA